MKNFTNYTINEILQHYVEIDSDFDAFLLLPDGETEKAKITYGQLDTRAKMIAAQLQQKLNVGDRVMLCYAHGLEFICGFFGCLYAGIVAVPAYPLKNNHHAKRLVAILEDCDAHAIMGTADSLSFMGKSDLFSEMLFLETDLLDESLAASYKPYKPSLDDLAFLQYTSGSTGDPKGVMITHNNIIYNEQAIGDIFCSLSENRDQYCASWLPIYHDMGLIGQILHLICLGGHEIIMPPAAFLEKPLRWLSAISKYRSIMTGSPNFGYQLCVEKITTEEMTHLDLSCWVTAYVGSEPVRASTLNAFAEKFAPVGFNPHAFLPCYGMAETTLIVSGKPRAELPVITNLDKNDFTKGIFTVNSDSDFQLVSSGKIHPYFTAKIVNPNTLELAQPNEIGEIWLHGPCVARGYWNKPEKTEEIFKARLANDDKEYLRTGDLGYILNEELYITGRLKDLIILQGRNLYPQDVEHAVEASSPAIRNGCTAAFSVDINGQEQLIIVAEIERTYRKADLKPIFTAIRHAVAQEVEAIPFSIQLLQPVKALKTSSGKIQRQATKKAYLDGTLETVGTDDLLVASTQVISLEQVKSDIHLMLAKLLGIDANTLDPMQTFSLLGATSLDGFVFLQQLQTYVGTQIKLPPNLIYELHNIDALGEYIYKALSGEQCDIAAKSFSNAAHQQLFEHLNKARFSTNTTPQNKIEFPPQKIFLTGATGILGAYLVKTFLEKTTTDIVCLIRAKDKTEGIERIKSVIHYYDKTIGNSTAFKSRVSVILGDIALEKFGLSDDEYSKAYQGIDIVLHAAANTSLLANYEELIDVNLIGTKNIIDFALKTQSKLLAYCSSYSIFGDRLFSQNNLYKETEFNVGQSFDALNYQRTKFEAEILIRAAQAQGLKWFIFRPGNIMGDSQTGRYPLTPASVSSFYYDIFKTVIETKTGIDSNLHFDLTPVNYVSEAICYWVMQYRIPQTVAHLTNPTSTLYKEWMHMLKQIGYDITLVAPTHYVELVRTGELRDKNGPYHSFTTAFVNAFPQWVTSSDNGAIDCAETTSILSQGNITCPEINATVLKKYMEHFFK